MYNGPDFECGQEFSYAVNGDKVLVHCGWFNPHEGLWFDYLYNSTNKSYGWVPDLDVLWEGDGEGC